MVKVIQKKAIDTIQQEIHNRSLPSNDPMQPMAIMSSGYDFNSLNKTEILMVTSFLTWTSMLHVKVLWIPSQVSMAVCISWLLPL